ncbi:PREDICTED: F-box/FBD/LRR-repeat protein At1g13570-like [Fragaria vesca subsp. vesca]|uniref:F-box/FBD/LRR-repeat protein At1g13570-like n=1 Tax=Fragaria vesca subsp. vesca TaxID=101020 RepID=UPI0002C2F295|nr:PREDICTED: F-box/FBD/LRR-repeat protein At1g13570-like [Fragaria vesca subsp. vesca]XP_011461820.1 PREDICTED: F-box/FBD/LRR-repeat protein At1g13570-like [Fragaria vesca subsp. vesca]
MELDRISNLPSGIMEKILSCLPLKDTVRTSVLSSQWRYKAAMLQHLVFDYQCRSAHSDTTFADIVDHVLLAHIGPIHKFELTLDHFASKDMDRWILHLSRNSIKEFILRHWGRPYKIPSCLFSCQDIISLELSCCLLEPPPTFKGFRGLKSLHFDRVFFAQDVFEHLIISCPLLESLTLIYCDSFSHLMIDAPNLKFLYVRGSFKDVLLVNTSNLVDVSIGLEDFEFYVSQRQVSKSSSNLVKILSCLPQVQKLDFFCCSTMYLAIGALPVKLPRPCLYLNCLNITLCLSNLEESLTALCLFRSCPALQELEVQVFPGEEVVAKGNSWLDDNRKCSFSQLRSVFINDIRGSKPELDFIRYLLLNSPVLERMTVQPVPGVESSKIGKKLLRSSRASVHSKLIFQDQ